MKNQKIVIELFSGSKIVSNTFENRGFKSFSVDNNSKYNPDLCIDILKLEKHHLPAHPAFIWLSPVCTHFSRAADKRHWNKTIISRIGRSYSAQTPEAENSILLLKKSIEVLSWYPDTPFILENPVGRIIHFSDLQNTGHHRYYVNYFDFGFDYSKETFLFTNLFLPLPVKRKKVHAGGIAVRCSSGFPARFGRCGRWHAAL